MRALQALTLAAVGGGSAAVPPKPHLIYLLADDYGWANVGFHAADMHTPNIDRLATEEGFELGRLYAYRFCSPTRSALMSGRLPYHVNQNNNAKWGWTEAAVKPSMKMLPEKLQEAGYYTVHAGKWHLGLARQAFTPVGRGFNESLAMLMGSEQHFTQRNGLGPSVQHVDLWASDRPALDQNGTYSANLFGGFGERVLRRHAAINEQQGLAEPLFMYLAGPGGVRRPLPGRLGDRAPAVRRDGLGIGRLGRQHHPHSQRSRDVAEHAGGIFIRQVRGCNSSAIISYALL
jgi:arylsulfatase B